MNCEQKKPGFVQFYYQSETGAARQKRSNCWKALVRLKLRSCNGVLVSIGSRVWTAQNRAGLEVCFDWRAAVLSLNRNGLFSSSSLNTDRSLLWTGRSAKIRTAHKYFVVKNE